MTRRVSADALPLVVAVVICSLSLAAASTAVGSPATTKGRVTYRAVTGNDRYLIYSVRQGHTAKQYVARDASGRTWVLPEQARSSYSFSISRNLLVDRAAARWWNLGTHAHGRIAKGYAIAAAPDGWLVDQGNHNRILDVSTTGTVRTVAAFPHGRHVPYATAGPRGVLLSNSHHATYVKWLDLGHKIKIDLGLWPGEYLRCDNLDSFAAGCDAERDYGDDEHAQRPALVRLDGKTEYGAVSKSDTIDPVVVKHALSWWDSDDSYYRFTDDATSKAHTKTYDDFPVAAYGHVIVQRGRSLVEVSPALKNARTIVS